ncbi:glutathione S transferase-like protein [Euroglyphus maynei]|uniref:Glutathione S transferase-like protein n=1 Tax=Euroglyphus maynei TaxID=6958 RepID=A0A1Y3BAG5_EURMA|nr:glutathione S transferase-like protein [Euroglyphus maynei]
MTIVELFFDIISPFSRFQHELLMRQLGHWKSMHLKMTPVMIREVFASAENMPPGMNQSKAIYLNRDLKRLTEFHKIPFALPKDFMEIAMEFKTDPAQLFLSAIQHQIDEATYNRLVGVFFLNFFTSNPIEVWNPDIMRKFATELGVSSDIVDKTLETMNSEETKGKLEKNLERVKELGGFGLPITLIHLNKPQWVFGSDRMHIIGHLLNEKQPPILQKQ